MELVRHYFTKDPQYDTQEQYDDRIRAAEGHLRKYLRDKNFTGLKMGPLMLECFLGKIKYVNKYVLGNDDG